MCTVGHSVVFLGAATLNISFPLNQINDANIYVNYFQQLFRTVSVLFGRSLRLDLEQPGIVD